MPSLKTMDKYSSNEPREEKSYPYIDEFLMMKT